MSLFATALIACSPAPGALAAPAPAPSGDQEVFAVYCAGAPALLTDPRDRHLLDALSMLDERLAELPQETGGKAQIPPDVVPLVSRLVGGPMSLRVGLAAEPIEGMPVPLFAQLSLPEGDPAAAQVTADRVARLLQMAGIEAQPSEGGLPRLGAPVPAWAGAHGNDFVLAVGKSDSGPVRLDGHRLPAGVEPLIGVRMDYGLFMQFMLQLAQQSGEADMMQGYEMMKSFGLADMKFEWVAGHDDERSYSVMSMPGYARTMRETGTLPEHALTEGALRMVPEDATWAAVGSINVAGTFDLVMSSIRAMMAEEYDQQQDPIELLASFTGIHLEHDIIDNLGATWGCYASDSTGGGGMLSLVLFMELADAQALAETRTRLQDMLNGFAQMGAKGYVRVRRWQQDEAEYATLSFPGLPVPFEPTTVIDSGYAFMGLTPQAALAAVAQARSGAHSLLDNGAFRQQMDHPLEGLYAVSFCDTPRLLRDGYGMTSLLCSALSNAVRSPRNPSREPGVILPPYREFVAGARAVVGYAYVDGDDYVQEQRSDRSVLVNAASAIGFVASNPLILGLAAAIPMGIAQAESEQEKTRFRAEIRQLRSELETQAPSDR